MNVVLKFKEVIFYFLGILNVLLVLRGALGFWSDRNFFYKQKFSKPLVREWLKQFKKKK